LAALNEAIAKAQASHAKPKDVAQLQAMAVSLDKDADAAKSPADGYRMHALAGIMKQSGTAFH
jgi:predicted cobalt transporter CbtA